MVVPVVAAGSVNLDSISEVATKQFTDGNSEFLTEQVPESHVNTWTASLAGEHDYKMRVLPEMAST